MKKEELIESMKSGGFPANIVNAFERVRREEFVIEEQRELAYEDTALSLEKGATISQPYTIAFMLQLLELKEGQKVLEIGSGCGYVLALISEIIIKGEIYGIEIIESLALRSKKILDNDKKIEVFIRNGFSGLEEKAPFDRILISASASKEPVHLYSQLKNNGIIVVPVGNSIFQIKKVKSGITKKEFPEFVFVPLVKKN